MTGTTHLGHLRIGTLPKSARWREVVGLIESSPGDASGIARATLLASEDYLRGVSNDPALVRAYWMLVRLENAARGSGLKRSKETTSTYRCTH